MSISTVLIIVVVSLAYIIYSVSSNNVVKEYELDEVGSNKDSLRQVFIFGCFATILIVISSTLYDIYYVTTKKNPIFTSFSLKKNLPVLLNTNDNTNAFACIDGIRNINGLLVVISHMFLSLIKSNSSIFENPKDLANWNHSPWYYLVMSAHLTIDIAFSIGGLCLVHSFMMQRERGESFNLLKYYFRRYIRYTPSFLAAVILNTVISDMDSHIPFDTKNSLLLNNCHRSSWFRTLTYTQTMDLNNYCFQVGWTLNETMKLFYISPIILFALWKYEKPTKTAIYAIIAYSNYAFYSAIVENNIRIERIFDYDPDFLNIIYCPMKIKIGVWLVGILFGNFLYQNRDKKFEISKASYWIISSLMMLLLVTIIFLPYILTEYHWDIDISIIFGLARMISTLPILWIIFTCIKGPANALNWFLSLPGWQLINKLSFSIYLQHISLIIYFMKVQETKFFFNAFQILINGLGIYLFSFFLAIPWTLIFELPFLNIEKELSKKFFSNAVINNKNKE